MRHLGIRGRVLAVLAPPVAGLALAGTVLSGAALQEADAARRAGALATAGTAFSQLADAVQTERLLSVSALAGGTDARVALRAARTATDQRLRRLEADLAAGEVPQLSAAAAAAIEAAVRAHGRLAAVRAGVDDRTATLDAVHGVYGDVVDAGVELPAAVAQTLTDREQAARLTGFTLLGRAVEAAALTRLTGLEVIDAGAATAAHRAELASQRAARDGALEAFRRSAGSDQVSRLTTALTTGRAAAADVERLRSRLAEATAATPARVERTVWTEVTTQHAAQLRAVADAVAAQASLEAAQAAQDAVRRLAAVGATVVAVLGLSILLGLSQSRRLAAPLRELTDVATRMRAELPAIVREGRVPRSDGDGDSGDSGDSDGGDSGGGRATVSAGLLGRRDEAGRLGAALADLQETTLRSVEEQAALRTAVNGMFVNVARRTQALLTRQLALIDSLERSEEDPDALRDLFRLDHQASRMRRNAESLLVLAGVDSGRRLREPMALSDVVRSATSEIEHYPRVRVELDVDPAVVAHLALPAAHLLAELLENATAFSDPGSTVVVRSTARDGGVRLTVTDHGLGMSPQDLDAGNARLADPAAADAVGSQRLGFFVVARLAGRLGAAVRLRPAPAGAQGTVAEVDLPAVLFAGGAVPAPVVMPVSEPVYQPVMAVDGDPTPDPVDPGADPIAPDVARVQAAPPVLDAATAPPAGRAEPAHRHEPPPAEPDRRERPPVPERPVETAPHSPTMDVLPSRSTARGFRLARRPRPGGGDPPSPPPVPTASPPARPGDRTGPPGREAAGTREATEGRGAPDGAVTGRDRERVRSALASQALSELSALSSYSPAVRDGASSALTRRSPAASAAPSEATRASADDRPDGDDRLDIDDDGGAPARPQRTPDEVRTMLAGFQDG